MTTDEQKIKLIEKELRDWDGHRFKDEVAKAILNSLKQFDPEPLEVEIVASADPVSTAWIVQHLPQWKSSYVYLNICLTEKEAIDFCAKHGLRVKK